MEGARFKEVFHGQANLAEWFQTHFWHMGALWQALALLGAAALGYLLARQLCAKLGNVSLDKPGLKDWVDTRLSSLLTPLFGLLLIQVVYWSSMARGWPLAVTEFGIKFSEAWLVIQLFASILLPPGWTKAVTAAVVGAFFLEVLGILDPMLAYMDKLALTFDNERVSVLEIVKAVLLLAVMLPLINKFCALMEAGLERVAEMKPRVRVLMIKLTKAGFYIVAFVTALDLVGINLQMLTVFSGAVGLGIGIGLQKVVSNLVSGVVLLLDNSIKPGDVIEVGGVYGRVESMNARFASMVTRDGKSYLIPNDELVQEKVVNWTFTGPSVRLKIPVAVAYSTDLKLAMELMLKSTEDKERVLANPSPNVLLKEFGKDGIVLELRVWMVHPERGVANVASAIQTSMWDFFTQNGIEFPFPQRDLHVKDPLKVQVEYVTPGQGGQQDGES
ncbi:MAG: mechanosensitive ion channel [Desulfovibrio sp.]|nr:mechanosensitive ion channel [Desulfovibrio sp.]MBI4958900.1 mechanosensitive ion channel [Desulfovibrio sp.]